MYGKKHCIVTSIIIQCSFDLLWYVANAKCIYVNVYRVAANTKAHDTKRAAIEKVLKKNYVHMCKRHDEHAKANIQKFRMDLIHLV
jgi:hypothetical protein